MNHTSHSHLDAERIQAFLDGAMPREEHASAQAHLASCRRCAAELEAWETLFEDLGSMRAHRPHQGFEDRVMARVRIPEQRSLVERLRDRLASAFQAHEQSHVPGHVLQDFLDGSLAARRAHRIEEHLSSCRTCTEEADEWLAVIRRLDGLGSFAPADGFAERVMSEVTVPEPVSLAARIRSAVDAVLGPSATQEHVPGGLLQDLVDGSLPPTVMARVQAHVADCGGCAAELASWRRLSTSLEGLERLEPSEDFAGRVMAGLREAPAAAAVTSPAPAWRRTLAAARRSVGRLVPETRQLVAALSGAAVTPMAVVGVLVWALWSHPSLTFGSLVSYTWWQVSDLATTTMAAASGLLTRNVQLVELYGLVESAASAPAMLAAGALLYTVVCGLALRVLYKNLFANRPSRARYAHVSTAS